MPVAPAIIVRTKRSWPGTSTTESDAARGQRQARVAERDRDAARALLGQAVGVDARERAHEGGLAVVDVPGRAEGARGRLLCGIAGALMRAASASRERAAVEHERAVRRRARARRDRPRAGARRAGRRRPRAARRRTAARPAAARRRRRARPSRRRSRRCARPAPRRARARRRRARATARRTGSSARARAGIAVDAQRGLERRQRELVDAQRARQRVPAAGCDRIGAAGQDAGLRTAEQLVAREADEIAAVAQGVARERLAGQLGGLEQRARADVVDQRERRLVRDPGQLAHLDAAREADHAVVGRMHAQQQRRSRARARACSRRRSCDSSCRPRAAARPRSARSRGCGSRRRSRPAARARRRSRARRPAPRAPARARRRRC